MKFGVFLPNGSNGYIVSKAVEPYLPTFEHNLAITKEAEKQGLDFVLSMMKFRGFGGETGYWDACLETFTLMSGLAAATDRIGLVPSVTLLTQHPAYVARMMATLDDISGGRCALNIVTGWNKPEYTQMGLWRGDEYYEKRYELASDYVTILKDLWANGRTTHKSEYYDLEDCSCLPTPKHPIEIVSAGQSPKGVEFVAAQANQNFVMAQPAKLKEISHSLKAKGSAQGRTVGTYALFGLITAETDEAAHAEGERIIAEADEGAIANILSSASMDTNAGGTSERLKSAL
ncbi:MAG: LLM class flavin-dependent oxidoreductase, partial [Pseudomonadota bacterium]